MKFAKINKIKKRAVRVRFGLSVLLWAGFDAFLYAERIIAADYSLRRASIGLRFAALIAGKSPNATPITVEKSTAIRL